MSKKNCKILNDKIRQLEHRLRETYANPDKVKSMSKGDFQKEVAGIKNDLESAQKAISELTDGRAKTLADFIAKNKKSPDQKNRTVEQLESDIAKLDKRIADKDKTKSQVEAKRADLKAKKDLLQQVQKKKQQAVKRVEKAGEGFLTESRALKQELSKEDLPKTLRDDIDKNLDQFDQFPSGSYQQRVIGREIAIKLGLARGIPLVDAISSAYKMNLMSIDTHTVNVGFALAKQASDRVTDSLMFLFEPQIRKAIRGATRRAIVDPDSPSRVKLKSVIQGRSSDKARLKFQDRDTFALAAADRRTRKETGGIKQPFVQILTGYGAIQRQVMESADAVFSGIFEQQQMMRLAGHQLAAEIKQVGKTDKKKAKEMRDNFSNLMAEKVYGKENSFEDALAQARSENDGQEVDITAQRSVFDTTDGNRFSENDTAVRAYEIMQSKLDKKLVEDSKQYALSSNLQQEPTGVAGSVAAGMNGLINGEVRVGNRTVRPFKILETEFPFVNVLANVANIMTDFTPAGAVRSLNPSDGRGGERSVVERRQQLYRSFQGVALFGLATGLTRAFDGDEDEQGRQRGLKIELGGSTFGVNPNKRSGNNVKSGNIRISWPGDNGKIQKFDKSFKESPWGLALAGAAGLSEALENGQVRKEEVEALTAYIGMSMYYATPEATKLLIESSPFKPIFDFVDDARSRNKPAFEGAIGKAQQEAGKKIIDVIATSTLPVGLSRDINEFLVDKKIDTTRNWKTRLWSMAPYASETTAEDAAKINVFGDPIERTFGERFRFIGRVFDRSEQVDEDIQFLEDKDEWPRRITTTIPVTAGFDGISFPRGRGPSKTSQLESHKEDIKSLLADLESAEPGRIKSIVRDDFGEKVKDKPEDFTEGSGKAFRFEVLTKEQAYRIQQIAGPRYREAVQAVREAEEAALDQQKRNEENGIPVLERFTRNDSKELLKKEFNKILAESKVQYVYEEAVKLGLREEDDLQDFLDGLL